MKSKVGGSLVLAAMLVGLGWLARIPSGEVFYDFAALVLFPGILLVAGVSGNPHSGMPGLAGDVVMSIGAC